MNKKKFITVTLMGFWFLVLLPFLQSSCGPSSILLIFSNKVYLAEKLFLTRWTPCPPPEADTGSLQMGRVGHRWPTWYTQLWPDFLGCQPRVPYKLLAIQRGRRGSSLRICSLASVYLRRSKIYGGICENLLNKTLNSHFKYIYWQIKIKIMTNN